MQRIFTASEIISMLGRLRYVPSNLTPRATGTTRESNRISRSKAPDAKGCAEVSRREAGDERFALLIDVLLIKQRAIRKLDVTILAQLAKWEEVKQRAKPETEEKKIRRMVGTGRFELPTPRTPSDPDGSTSQ